MIQGAATLRTMNKLVDIKNAEYGIEAYVIQSTETGEFHAILRDVDAEETVSVIYCPTFEQAKSKAEEFVR